MTSIAPEYPSVNLDHDAPAESTPSPEDAAWAAQAFADAYHDECPELPEADCFDPADDFDFGPVDELAAAEAAFLDAHELGLFGPALAERLMARSLVGHMELP